MLNAAVWSLKGTAKTNADGRPVLPDLSCRLIRIIWARIAQSGRLLAAHKQVEPAGSVSTRQCSGVMRLLGRLCCTKYQRNQSLISCTAEESAMSLPAVPSINQRRFREIFLRWAQEVVSGNFSLEMLAKKRQRTKLRWCPCTFIQKLRHFKGAKPLPPNRGRNHAGLTHCGLFGQTDSPRFP